MKARVIIAAVATLAMLMPCAASAQRNQRHSGGKMTRIERTFDNRHMGKKAIFAKRPNMGARFMKRPAFGQFVNMNRERLWLADGVLYRVIRSGNTLIYIVVGYM